MIKYYIEIVDLNGQDPYLVQSKWYNTKEEALGFVKQISFCKLTISLMSSIWNEESNTYTDIQFEGNLN